MLAESLETTTHRIHLSYGPRDGLAGYCPPRPGSANRGLVGLPGKGSGEDRIAPDRTKKWVRYRARTVDFRLRLRLLRLALNEKQIPQVVGNNRSASRKWKTWRELSSLQSRCFQN